MIYPVCFAVSVFFSYVAYKTEKRWKFWVFSFLSLSITLLLAGLRDYSVGTDTSHYYKWPAFWGKASTLGSFGKYMKFYLNQGFTEVLFAALIGVVAHTGSFTLFLFLAHAWILVWVYIGIHRLRHYVQPWMVLLLFYFAFYNHSLNIMRQYMALSFIFAFYMDLPQKKYLRYSIVVVIASLFHISGLISIFLLLIHWFLCGKHEKLKTISRLSFGRRQQIIFLIVLLFIACFNPFVRVLVKFGFIHGKYLYYVSEPFTSYNLLVILFLMIEMIALRLFYKDLREKNSAYGFFFTVSVVYFLMYQITAIVLHGKRIAAFGSLPNLVTLALLPHGLRGQIAFTLPKWLGERTIVLFRFPKCCTEKQRHMIGNALVFVGVLAYWLYVYLLRNSSGTLPYSLIF